MKKKPVCHVENAHHLAGGKETCWISNVKAAKFTDLIASVWHLDNVEQYHPTKNRDGGLFTQYVNTFMKMKLESEGYPARAQMDEQKREYEMEVYNNRENISLDLEFRKILERELQQSYP
uniref:Uncharacterized protein n=1 Tax=Romanomermis culicivorax TaxID=13658 RepID=A0A915IB23_ROMCU